MRDRFIELLQKRSCYYNKCNGPCSDCGCITIDDDDIGKLVGDLLANGAVVPPVKVGQTVYFLHNGIELCEARIICTEDNYYTNPQMWITVEFFSKVIGINTYKSRIDLMLNKIMFLTREEAERALKGGE